MFSAPFGVLVAEFSLQIVNKNHWESMILNDVFFFCQAIPWMHFMDLRDFFFGHGIKGQNRWLGDAMKKPSSKDKDLPFFGYPSARCLVVLVKLPNCQVFFDQEKLDEFKINR